jgi:hypothetical protein
VRHVYARVMRILMAAYDLLEYRVACSIFVDCQYELVLKCLSVTFNIFPSYLQSIINVFRACIGLPPDNYMQLEHKVKEGVALLLFRTFSLFFHF